VLAILLFVSFVANNNSENTNDVQGDSNQEDETLTISASFYPLAYFTERIVGDKATVINIGEGLDPHDFTPSAKDITTLQSSDLVILLGAEFEPWGDSVVEQLNARQVPVLIATEHVKLLSLSEKDEHGHGEEAEHVEETEHESEDAHEGEDEHGHGEFDPHVWLDPVLTQDIVKEIVEKLVAIDPGAADTYEANGATLIAELKALDTSYSTRLSSCTVPEAIVSHDAFSYLSARYNLDMHPIAGISTQDEPSAKVLAELVEEAKEGITTILTEESSVTEFADTLSRETGLALITINPIEYFVPAGEDYFSLMQTNLDALTTAYGCSR